MRTRDIASLTPRQREVFDLAITAMRPTDIARELRIHTGTTAAHLRAVCIRLGIANRHVLIQTFGAGVTDTHDDHEHACICGHTTTGFCPIHGLINPIPEGA